MRQPPPRDKKPTAAPAALPTGASHDAPFPPALLDFMMQKWRPQARRKVPKVRGVARFAARRKALSEAFAGEVLVIPTGHEKVRANDTNYPFRAGTEFYYLTGNLEPDCVLMLWPEPRGGHTATLFVEPNPGRASSTFFTDRVKGELWVGPRLGVPESQQRYGIERAAPLGELPDMLKRLRGPGQPKARVLRGVDAAVDAAVPARRAEDKALAEHLSEMRLIKDNLEVAALRRACASTRRGFEDVIARLGHAKSEREVEGVFNLRARMEGNAVGYGTIAAAGAHACILHWTHNDGELRRGDLLLLDAGVEGNELYTADVTRTLPISGTFSPAQKQIYELVLAAQLAGLAEVRPGRDFLDPHKAAMAVLTRGLCDMGILKMSFDEAIRPENQFYKRYTLHGTSHMLGLDVHDCAQARQQTYRYGKLRAGMVLTVEPGLYFQRDDLSVPARLRGIGVRIEDDVLVTRRGHEVLSDEPKRVKDVEAWMRKVWKGAKK